MPLVDKDKPDTWVRYKESLCRSCIGTCCTMPVEVRAADLVRLGLASQDEIEGSPRKVSKRLIKEGIVQSYRDGTGLFMFTQKYNGDCYFLDSASRLCTVYEKRPETCRRFPVSMGNKLGHCPVIKKN